MAPPLPTVSGCLLLIAALFGSSWHLVSGPTNAISIVLFASVSVLAEPGSADYIKLSPNNKIPAIVDTDGPGGGPYTMMESGAILF